jgi:hypothetical protein
MKSKKRIPPGEKVPLKLTPTETKAILETLLLLDEEHEHIIRETPTGKPVMMTLDDLEDFAGYIAAEANHTEDEKLARKLDKVYDKCHNLLDTYTDQPDDAITAEQAKRKTAKGVTDLLLGEESKPVSFRLKSKTPKSAKFPIKITPHQRASLKYCTRLKAAIKRKLELAENGTQIIEFTKKELDQLDEEISQAVVYARSPHKQRLVAVQKKVDDILNELELEDFGIKRPKQRRQPKDGVLIQLKISLLDITPTIWRRIQVKDCTLDDLHEHIQTAMGWTNSHLHQFEIKGRRYGNPDVLDDGFEDFECIDSTEAMVSHVLPKSGKRYRFQYIYDFGDEWRHEILFEGYPPLGMGKKYPVCLEGERACPPEDIGGPWGHADYLEALADPEHELHDEYMEWTGAFDPEAFSTEQTTKAMRKGLPKFDW